MLQNKDDADKLTSFTIKPQEIKLKDIESKSKMLKDTPISQTVAYRQVFPRHEYAQFSGDNENVFDSEALNNYCITNLPTSVNRIKELVNSSCSKIAKGAY